VIEIYLDNASSTMVMKNVSETISNCMTSDYGNPSSAHLAGERAAIRLKDARDVVSSVLSCNPSEIVFTSGGTEANYLAISGAAYLKKRRGMHCITTLIEHQSVMNAYKRLAEEGFEVSYIPVTPDGIIKIEKLEQLLRKDTSLVSIMHINNEIGSIQPLREVGRILSNLPNQPLFHVDAIQSFCKYPVNPIEWGAHIVSVSAHKIHAPKGVGALYIKSGLKLKPMFAGGEQESGLRAGTQNIPGIVGLSEAVQSLRQKSTWDTAYLSRLKRLFFEGLKKAIPEVCLIGPKIEEGACHILSISIPGIPAEVMQRSLSAWHGVCVGIGSACSSRKKYVSHVLKAINLDPRLAGSTIRVSFSYMNTDEQIMLAIAAFADCYKRLLR